MSSSSSLQDRRRRQGTTGRKMVGKTAMSSRLYTGFLQLLLLMLVSSPFGVHGQTGLTQVTYQFTGEMTMAPISYEVNAQVGLPAEVLEEWNELTSTFFQRFYTVDLGQILDALQVENLQANFIATDSLLGDWGSDGRIRTTIQFFAEITYITSREWQWDPAEMLLDVYNTEESFTDFINSYRNSGSSVYGDILSIGVATSLPSTKTTEPYVVTEPPIVTPAPITPAPTTPAPTTPRPTTEAPTTANPTLRPTTDAPTLRPTTLSPTNAPVTDEPTNVPTDAPVAAITPAPTTLAPTTEAPVPTTSAPSSPDGTVSTTSPSPQPTTSAPVVVPTDAPVGGGSSPTTPSPTSPIASNDSGEDGTSDGDGGGDQVGDGDGEEDSTTTTTSSAVKQDGEEKKKQPAGLIGGIVIVVGFVVIVAMVGCIVYYHHQTKKHIAQSQAGSQVMDRSGSGSGGDAGGNHPTNGGFGAAIRTKDLQIKPTATDVTYEIAVTPTAEDDVSTLAGPFYLGPKDCDDPTADEEKTYADQTVSDLSQTTRFQNLLHGVEQPKPPPAAYHAFNPFEAITSSSTRHQAVPIEGPKPLLSWGAAFGQDSTVGDGGDLEGGRNNEAEMSLAGTKITLDDKDVYT